MRGIHSAVLSLVRFSGGKSLSDAISVKHLQNKLETTLNYRLTDTSDYIKKLKAILNNRFTDTSVYK